jgi:cytochrome o ubiquinol oxidase operon protein cyoD
MTDIRFDRAPGDRPILTDREEGTPAGVLVYTTGLVLAIILTATSFWVANTSLIWGPGVPIGLVVLAIAQMGIHLVFFLHITTGPDNTNNVLALAFGILIVLLFVVGSTVIMANLNENLMPPPEVMNLHMQH